MTSTTLNITSSKLQALLAIKEKMESLAGSLPLISKPEDIIPGDGNPDAKIMFIGEAGGRNEAIQRKPFVGVAGKLLARELNNNGYQREDVYISNVVKTRPPDNRDPLPEEIAAFKPFLDQEIEIIQPKLLVTLGRFSMAKFIPDVKISQVHGRLHRVQYANKTRYVLPFYHPAAALRQGVVMDAFIKDFTKIPKILKYIDSPYCE